MNFWALTGLNANKKIFRENYLKLRYFSCVLYNDVQFDNLWFDREKMFIKEIYEKRWFFFANLFTYILCLNIFLLVLRWYGIPVDINVDLSTLWSKYFHRFKIFSNFTIFDSKICFKMFWKDWNYKGSSAIRTHDLFNAIAILTFTNRLYFLNLLCKL